MEDGYRIPPGADIGHIHLKVADIDRAIAFYRDVLGMELTATYGQDAAFLSAGGYHHHLAVNVWGSRGGSPPPHGSTGLFHFAIRYPTKQDLTEAVRRVMRAGVPLIGATDHRVSLAVYLRDPDGNGVELMWDRPREEWTPAPEGTVFVDSALDLAELLGESA